MVTMADDPTQWDDETLLAALAQAYAEVEQVPDSFRHAARGAFAWRTVEDDLMSLVDPATLYDEAMAVRGDDDLHEVAFSGGGLTLELEVLPDRVLGQVVPAGECEVTWSSPAGGHGRAVSDGSGYVELPGVGSGPVRFSITADGRTRVTEWVTL